MYIIEPYKAAKTFTDFYTLLWDVLIFKDLSKIGWSTKIYYFFLYIKIHFDIAFFKLL